MQKSVAAPINSGEIKVEEVLRTSTEYNSDHKIKHTILKENSPAAQESTGGYTCIIEDVIKTHKIQPRSEDNTMDKSSGLLRSIENQLNPLENSFDILPFTTLRDLIHSTGKRRGVSGSTNTTHLDAALFSLFYCTDIFDDTILSECNSKGPQTKLSKKIRSILKNEIIYSLRLNYFCPESKILKLRDMMSCLYPNNQDFIMDVGQFLNLLFKTLSVNEFIQYSNGTAEYIHLIVPPSDSKTQSSKQFTTVQELFETSKNCQKLLSTPNPALFIQISRSKDFTFNKKVIVPQLQLDISNMLVPEEKIPTTQLSRNSNNFLTRTESDAGGEVMEKTPQNQPSSSSFRKIIDNTMTRAISCLDYFSKSGAFLTYNSDQFGFFVVDNQWNECMSTDINSRVITTEQEVYLKPHSTKTIKPADSPSPPVLMDLFAVICEKDCHYTSFVKCGDNSNDNFASWVYFDSIGQGVCEVREVKDCEKWLKELVYESSKNIEINMATTPDDIKLLVLNSHVFIYKP